MLFYVSSIECYMYEIFNIVQYLANIKLLTPSICLSQRNSLRVLGYIDIIFERYSPTFDLVFFLGFRPNPYTRMCIPTIGLYSTLGKTSEQSF